MITPAVSLNSIQPRNPVQELTLTSTRSESSSDLTQVERPSQSAILPAQVVSVTTLSEEVAPTDENEASVSDRALGAQDSSFSTPDPAEAAQIRELAARDREVRQHELAHKSAAGSLAGAISFDYQRGPDGKLYAVGGEVDIRTTPASSDPADVVAYAEQVIRAALAPAEPSSQDRQVAAQARVMLAEAQAELAGARGEAQSDTTSDDAPDSDAGRESLETTLFAESQSGASRDDESKAEDIQEGIAETRERTAESLAEFQQTMNEVNQRLVEVNQRLAELGVLEEIYQTGSVLTERA